MRLPSSHTTVRTDPYTAVHDHYDLACLLLGRKVVSISILSTIALFGSGTRLSLDSSA